MISKEALLQELRKRGYSANYQTVVKNGDVELEAITITDQSNIAPTIYIEQILKMDSLDEAVETVLNIYRNRPPFSVDLELLTDKEFIYQTVRIGIQKLSNQDGIKRPTEYDDIEQYLYFGEDGWSIRLTNDIMQKANINSLSKLWTKAEHNTFQHTTIKSMTEIMQTMLGDDFPDDIGEMDLNMYVITNDCGVKGASAILDKDFLAGFARKHKWNKIAILPSSIHEAIIIPISEDISIDYLDDMVREVNATQVEPTDRLIDHAIIVNF